MEWYEKYANKIGVQIDNETKEFILKGLEHNKSLYGFRYCPCSITKNQDTICPCKLMKENKKCNCELFIGGN